MRIAITLALLVICCASICVEVEPSFLAEASDCTISKLDEQTIKWGVKLTFLADVEHKSSNWINLLADMEHPRKPYSPIGSECTSQYGKYYEGQSVLLNCTQAFEDVPRDYVNAVYVLEDSVSPYGFSMKVPLSMWKEDQKE